MRDDTGVKQVVVAVLAALALPAVAAAHVEVRPGLLESGEEVELRIELPELRPGEPPAALEVLGPGVRQLSSRADGRRGQETRWRVRVAVDAPPGLTELTLRASFADGSVVDVERDVTVVPAGERGGGTPLVAFVAAGFGLAAMLAAAIVLRRPGRTA